MQIPKTTVVLNAFGRPDNLQRQLEAVRAQTIEVADILIWQNACEDVEFDSALFDNAVHAQCSTNLGVWARFAFALNARTEFVMVLDDDTIPGTKWLENCYRTWSKYKGLIGGNGVIFNDPNDYMNHRLAGWRNPNTHIAQVDIVGHSWFFPRDYLSIYWSELPDLGSATVAGEDIHFSYTLQKQGIGTYVPRHRTKYREEWSSLNGRALGRSGPAISRSNSKLYVQMQLPHYLRKGFKLLYTKS